MDVGDTGGNGNAPGGAEKSDESSKTSVSTRNIFICFNF